MSTLTLSGITARRGSRMVLRGVDATFAAGRLTVVIGPNGAGKSTLLAVAAGILAPTAGEVRQDGEPLGAIGRRALARRRAYLPQGAQVAAPITVNRVVALGLVPHLPAFGPLPPALSGAVEAALDRYDLRHLADRPVTQLSGGERARVMLARATVADPALLIVDEPLSGLDPRHAVDCADRLRRRADQGRTVVAALHDIDLALRIADDVVAIQDGALLAALPASAVDGALLSRLYGLSAAVRRDGGVHVRFG